MGSVGFGELVLMLLAAVIAVGPDRLPELARNAARMIRTIKGVAHDLTYELRREVGVDEASEVFRSYGFDEVKPYLTIKGSLPAPAAPDGSGNGSGSGNGNGKSPQPTAEAAPAVEEPAPPKAPEV
jgi:sec-independent protein translocase protein TatB